MASKELLSKYPLSEDMLSISTEELSTLLSKCSKGHFYIDKAKQIQNNALNSFIITFATRSFSFKIRQIINPISF